MRFLCLPGAIANAKNWAVQLGPFTTELESDGAASFLFTQGRVKTQPPPGFEDYFGPGPHYRFLEFDGMKQADVLEKIRDFPDEVSPEEAMRALMPEGEEKIKEGVVESLSGVYETLAANPDIEGIIGYSEGAVVSATLVLDEAAKFRKTGRPRQIKCAIFFAGWPPISMEAEGVVLSDESEEYIDVPTVHVVGAGDPYIQGAMALFNVCDQDTAELFDHGKGHTIPRDAKTLGELGNTVRKMIQSVRDGAA